MPHHLSTVPGHEPVVPSQVRCACGFIPHWLLHLHAVKPEAMGASHRVLNLQAREKDIALGLSPNCDLQLSRCIYAAVNCTQTGKVASSWPAPLMLHA